MRIALLALAGALGAFASAQTPSLKAVRTSDPPKVDGHMGDAAWNEAPVAGPFIDPFTGDFLFSTFGGSSQVVVVRGFTRPCSADFNGDGNLDPDDLSDYISCYFAQPPCPRADFSNDGITDPDDLADYIGAFFGGCP